MGKEKEEEKKKRCAGKGKEEGRKMRSGLADGGRPEGKGAEQREDKDFCPEDDKEECLVTPKTLKTRINTGFLRIEKAS